MIVNRINEKDSYYYIQKETNAEKEAGIYLIKKETQSIYVSTLFLITNKLVAETVTYYKVVFFDNKKQKIKYIKASDLLSDSLKESEAMTFLLNNGLVISYKCKQFFIDYIKCAIKQLNDEDATEKTGWINNEYISNGFSTTQSKIFVGNTVALFETVGDETLYKNYVSNIFKNNALAFAICSYCASSFFQTFLQNEINQILALTGTSSKGKSTVGKLALSLFTSPKQFRGMDATKYGMSLLAKNHKDNFIFFDENQESALNAEQRTQFIYSLANATERLRAYKFGDEYNIKNQEIIKYCVLIAGEKSFLNGIEKDGNGIDARYLEIFLDENNVLLPGITNIEQAEELNNIILENYGFVTNFFINYIKQNYTQIQKQYKQLLNVVRNEQQQNNNIANRKIRILAYTLISAQILCKYFLLDAEYADNAYLALKQALFSDVEKEEEIDVYKEKLTHIEETEKPFFEINGDKEKIREYFGFIKINESFKTINIITSKYSDFCKKMGFDEKLFISYLKQKQYLVHNANKNYLRVKKDGQNKLYYSIHIVFNKKNDELEKDDPFIT